MNERKEKQRNTSLNDGNIYELRILTNELKKMKKHLRNTIVIRHLGYETKIVN